MIGRPRRVPSTQRVMAAATPTEQSRATRSSSFSGNQERNRRRSGSGAEPRGLSSRRHGRGS